MVAGNVLAYSANEERPLMRAPLRDLYLGHFGIKSRHHLYPILFLLFSSGIKGPKSELKLIPELHLPTTTVVKSFGFIYIDS